MGCLYGRLELAFGGVPESPEDRELYKSLTDTDRSLGVWDGGACVGSAGAFALRLSAAGLGGAAGAGRALGARRRVGAEVRGRRAGALTETSRAFAGDVAPWLPHAF
ncbi:hypothetical protein [Streptomyces sp. NPDC090036]|uniref:hypothetical protein n=1 Tax=Streptomyces sp. NPDC090036 TaxID=3365926 RepID=UPI0037F5D436